MLGNSLSHQVLLKPEEWSRQWYHPYKISLYIHVNLIGHCYLSLDYQFHTSWTKACWCWDFQDFPKKQPVYLAVSQLQDTFRIVA